MPDQINNALRSLSAVNNIGFVPFTTGLIDGVFNSIVSSSIKQMNAYADLVQSVSQTLSEFKDAEIGTDRDVSAQKVITEVFGLSFPANANSDITVNADQTAQLGEGLNGIRISNKTVLETIASSSKIKAALLRDFVKAKLEQDAESKYEHLKTLLKMGMQKVVVDRGLIRTRLTFSVRASEFESKQKKALELEQRSSLNAAAGLGVSKSELSNLVGTAVATKSQNTLAVNVVNERSSAALSVNANVIGEVVIEFRTDSFPAANL